MGKELPKLTSIVTLVQAASRYTGGALPDNNHQSFPIPCAGTEGLRVAFFYCTVAIPTPREGFQLKPPRYIAFFNVETGAFEELKIFALTEWGLGPVEDVWLGSYLTPAERMAPEFLTKQIRLYQDYDLVMAPFAAGQIDIGPDVRKAAVEFRSLFGEITEKPLLLFYEAVGKQFFTWLNQIAS